MRTFLLLGLSCLLVASNVFADEDGFEDDDVQTEFYLPYSETEDVDFSISRDAGYGCYQW